MPIEREFKLIGASSTDVPDLDALTGVRVDHREALDLVATYYDTPTLSLARAGVTLRARTGEAKPIWTLKLPADSVEDEVSRHEHEVDAPLGPIPPELRAALVPYVRAQTLSPVLCLHTHRTQSMLHVDGEEVALLVDDDVCPEDGGNDAAGAFREIEIELVEGAKPADVEAVVHALRDAGFRTDDPLPKAIRALGPRATEPPDVAAVPISRKSPAGAVAHAAIARSVLQLVQHHGGVVLTASEEDVHQFRVATRRLRSDLHTFEPLLEPGWVGSVRAELKWLGSEVGAARDSDVLRARLQSQADALPAEDRDAAHRLIERVDAERQSARTRLVESLASDRYAHLIDALVDAARLPPFATDPPGVAYRPGRDVLVERVAKRWRTLRKAADALTMESPDAAFHAARIRAKQTRYAAEAVTPVFGGTARRFAKAVESVQAVLGEHQDTAVAEAWLRDAAKSLPASRLVIGELITVERVERLARRKEFESVWRKVSRPKVWDWLD